MLSFCEKERKESVKDEDKMIHIISTDESLNDYDANLSFGRGIEKGMGMGVAKKIIIYIQIKLMKAMVREARKLYGVAIPQRRG